MASDVIKCEKCNQPLRFNGGEPAIFHRQDCPDGKAGPTYVGQASRRDALAEAAAAAEAIEARRQSLLRAEAEAVVLDYVLHGRIDHD